MTISTWKQKQKEGDIEYVEQDISALRLRTQTHHVQWTIQGEQDFPAKACHITASPYILYYIGNLELLQMSILGIVGPRKHSAYATQVLQKLFSSAKNHSPLPQSFSQRPPQKNHPQADFLFCCSLRFRFLA